MPKPAKKRRRGRSDKLGVTVKRRRGARETVLTRRQKEQRGVLSLAINAKSMARILNGRSVVGEKQ